MLQLRQQCSQRAFRVSNETKVNLAAAADMFSAKVDLNDSGVLRKEWLIRKIRADHHQYFAIHHGEIAGGESEQAGHADVKGIVVLDEFLATIA